jgi:hypothetical protein
MIKILSAALFVLFSLSSYAMPLAGRLGVGMTNQVVTGIDSLSVKLQRNRSIAVSGIFGLDSSNESSNYALGIKVFRLIYDEPQLNFFSSLSAIGFTYLDENEKTESGYQVDATFGSEFTFQGLESIGFSFEFGIGMNRYLNKTTVKTVGHNMFMSAVHFYL